MCEVCSCLHQWGVSINDTLKEIRENAQELLSFGLGDELSLVYFLSRFACYCSDSEVNKNALFGKIIRSFIKTYKFSLKYPHLCNGNLNDTRINMDCVKTLEFECNSITMKLFKDLDKIDDVLHVFEEYAPKINVTWDVFIDKNWGLSFASSL